MGTDYKPALTADAPFPKSLTIGERYDPAMKITDADEAVRYFERLIEWQVTQHGRTRDEAESIEKQNLGYYAGYCDNETRERVERLFKCAHPIFGGIAKRGAPTPQEALAAGTRADS